MDNDKKELKDKIIAFLKERLFTIVGIIIAAAYLIIGISGLINK